MSRLSSERPVQILLVLLVFSCVCLESAFGIRRLFRNRHKAGQLNKPFVLLYEHENFRGKEHVQYISKECQNLPMEVYNWASSVDTHRTCASVCTSENCAGPCRNVYSNQGLSKLRLIDFNDKIKSVRTCF